MFDKVYNPPESTVYAAIELSKKSWIVAIMQPTRDQPSIHRIKGGAFPDLVMKLRTAARGGERLLVCYEAGYEAKRRSSRETAHGCRRKWRALRIISASV